MVTMSWGPRVTSCLSLWSHDGDYTTRDQWQILPILLQMVTMSWPTCSELSIFMTSLRWPYNTWPETDLTHFAADGHHELTHVLRVIHLHDLTTVTIQHVTSNRSYPFCCRWSPWAGPRGTSCLSLWPHDDDYTTRDQWQILPILLHMVTMSWPTCSESSTSMALTLSSMVFTRRMRSFRLYSSRSYNTANGCNWILGFGLYLGASIAPKQYDIYRYLLAY